MLIHRESHTGSHTYQNEDKHYTLTLTQAGKHEKHKMTQRILHLHSR